MIAARPAGPAGVAMIAGLAIIACAPLPLQLGFAAIAIGVVGMAHGASDLLVVSHARRPGFLLWYGVVGAACLVWWAARPAVALPVFLAASALHFGLEDAPGGGPVERLARGIVLVAAPATLHVAGLSALLVLAGLPVGVAPGFALGLAIAGGVAAAGLAITAVRRRDGRLLAGLGALVLLPPLIGFSVGFLVLHALPQTAVRQRRLGLASAAAYLRATAPVLLLAIMFAVAIGLWLLRWEASGVRSLFAAVAALAMPHLLVTPAFAAALGPAAGRVAEPRRLAAAGVPIRTAAPARRW